MNQIFIEPINDKTLKTSWKHLKKRKLIRELEVEDEPLPRKYGITSGEVTIERRDRS